MIKIPLIGSDIRFDEVTIRAIKTFEYLDNVVDQIFDKIDARIEQNMTRIGDINSRLEKASAKIEKLKTSKKAIRMFSPARYPIEDPKTIRPTFDSTFQPGDIDFHYKLDLPLERTDYKQYSDKLQFFHLKTPKREVPKQPSLIFQTSSINSLITFVNNENLFLKDTVKQKQELQTVDQKTDDDTTDFSRFSTMIRTKQQGDNFHYLPSVNQAPEFEFPLDLPDLEGIAGDISFSVPDEELLETNAFRALNIVNDLPNVAELMDVKKTQDPMPIQPPSIPEDLPLPPIPPPPPIPQSVVIPAPPPVPQSSVVVPPPVPQADNARSSLMEAIRKAGGMGKAKLKSIPAADEQPTDEVKKPTKAPDMSLMDDLKEKLARRHEAISGKKKLPKKEKISAGAMMDRVSSLIKQKQPSSDDSSSDRSDNDEWTD